MPVIVDLQIASSAADLPDEQSLSRWCNSALQADLETQTEGEDPLEMTVRIVDEDESAELNQDYRGKSGPTNVLSFPFESPPEVKINLLGDLVICAPVVAQEAREQSKSLSAHWAHMVVHGTLHLQGFDHIEDEDAAIMEELETTIILGLGFPAPYEND
jgi:probable rRNA maturation factor